MITAYDDKSRARRKAAELRQSASIEEALAMRAAYPAPFFRRADGYRLRADNLLAGAGLDVNGNERESAQ